MKLISLSEEEKMEYSRKKNVNGLLRTKDLNCCKAVL